MLGHQSFERRGAHWPQFVGMLGAGHGPQRCFRCLWIAASSIALELPHAHGHSVAGARLTRQHAERSMLRKASETLFLAPASLR